MNLEGDRLPSRDLRARGTGRSGSRWGAKASQPAEGVLQRPRGEADPRHLLRLERTEWVKENSHRKTIWQEF